MEINNRFYTFETEKNKYLYDNYTKQIYNVEDEIFNNINNKIFDPKEYSRNYQDYINSILNAEEKEVKLYKQNKCFITINVSNRCNLNCTYCYRYRDNKNQLTKENLKEIVEFATKRYMPEAEEYIFSFAFTSEPLMNINLIKDFDEIITDNEGFLLKNEDFIGISQRDLFEKFPDDIQEKYIKKIKGECYLTIINEILKNERLWSFWKDFEDEYISEMVSFSRILSRQKSAMANRSILQEKFHGLLKEPYIKYITLFFYTNGTLIDEESINLIKSFNMHEIWISLDGPENINNLYRNYPNGKSSYFDVIRSIKLLQKNNVKVNVNSVITPKYLNILEIIDFFKKNKINTLNFQIVRNEKIGFTLESINNYLENFDDVLEMIYIKILEDNYFYVRFLKEHLFFKILYKYYHKLFQIKRCNWGNKLSISSEGELYHCDSTVGLEDKIGTYKDDIQFSDIDDKKSVNNNEKCANCFAKNLCGGTCYYSSLKTGNVIDEVECTYRKGIIKRVLYFYVKLTECNKLEKVMDILSEKNEIENFITKNKTLPVNKSFILEQVEFNKIEGWFSSLSRAVFDSLFDFQKKQIIRGNCCEVGVWKGKSAVEISKFIDDNEKLLLIDPLLDSNKHEVLKNITKVTGKGQEILEIINKYSENYNYYTEGTQYFNSMRFIHIDGCHVGENVYKDLKMADKFLKQNGIVVVDDFFNNEYPQITEATYKYIVHNEYSFRIFLVGANKAYMCRPNSYALYNNYCMNQFQKEMLMRGIAVKIMKTSPIADTFSISFSTYEPSVDLPSGKQGFDWAPNIIEGIANFNSIKITS